MPCDLRPSSIKMEELQAKHRKELRDLQGRITQKKKQASKKSRKGVNDECENLEQALKAQQAEELALLNGDPSIGDGDDVEESAEQLNQLHIAQEPTPTDPAENASASANFTSEPAEEISNVRKGNNRQRARLARRAAEQDALVQQAVEEAKLIPDLKQQERSRMLAAMKERSLSEKVIRADGHCLYSAVADQLEQLQIPVSSDGGEKTVESAYKITRRRAADYIEQHPDDFVPFLEEPLSDYLHKIRETGEWGGQLELMALAKSYGVDINVLQDFGRVEKIEAGELKGGDERCMWLGYYKHGFGLGEHYNSLRKIP